MTSAELVAPLPDLTRDDVTDRRQRSSYRAQTPGAGLPMRSRDLVREYGVDAAGWSYRIGDLAAIISHIDGRIANGDWFEHTRDVLGRTSFTLAQAMDRDVNLDGRDPLAAAEV